MNRNEYIPTREEVYESLCKRHTKEIQDKIQAGKVAIAGLGGLGSTIAIALARAGVGRLHLIDFDRVDLSNLNRQQYRICDIGCYKTECLKRIIEEINPYIEIEIDTVKLNAENTATIFMEDDIICEAFDQAEAKAMLVDAFFSGSYQGKKLIAGSGMAGYESSNEIRTRKINEYFYLCGDEKNGLESKKCLMAPRVAICAGHEANLVIRLLAEQCEV